MRHALGCCTDGDDHAALQLLSSLDDALGECRPVKVRLDAGHEHEVTRTLGESHDEKVVFRPTDVPVAVFVDERFRAFLGEVEKRIRIDRCNDGDRTFLDAPLEGAGRHSGDVKPASEGDDEDGVT